MKRAELYNAIALGAEKSANRCRPKSAEGRTVASCRSRLERDRRLREDLIRAAEHFRELADRAVGCEEDMIECSLKTELFEALTALALSDVIRETICLVSVDCGTFRKLRRVDRSLRELGERIIKADREENQVWELVTRVAGRVVSDPVEIGIRVAVASYMKICTSGQLVHTAKRRGLVALLRRAIAELVGSQSNAGTNSIGAIAMMPGSSRGPVDHGANDVHSHPAFVELVVTSCAFKRLVESVSKDFNLAKSIAEEHVRASIAHTAGRLLLDDPAAISAGCQLLSRAGGREDCFKIGGGTYQALRRIALKVVVPLRASTGHQRKAGSHRGPHALST